MKRTITTAAGYAALSTYFRFRPQPPGINGSDRTFRVPADQITLFQDTIWFERGRRHAERQIADEVVQLIRSARRFVLMDVFLFNLHHTSGKTLVPTTRQISDAFRESEADGFFITDPLNVTYGTEHNEAFDWLRDAGVELCLTELRRLRDPNLIYSPLWRVVLQWLGTGDKGLLPNPLRAGRRTTARAIMEALTLKSNHRKVVIADTGKDSYATVVTSSNFEDASSYFSNVAVKVESTHVARHYLEAESAVAEMSGRKVPFSIPAAFEPERGDATVTPLMGPQIKPALLHDLQAAEPGERLFVFTFFLSERTVLRHVLEADRRGVDVTLVLDPNRVSFGEEKHGLPNQSVAAELEEASTIEVRFAKTNDEEFHTKFVLIEKPTRSVVHVGSANLDRLSLSNTNLENNVRLDVPASAAFSRHVREYARRVSREPISRISQGGDPSIAKYWLYRFQEATGAATF